MEPTCAEQDEPRQLGPSDPPRQARGLIRRHAGSHQGQARPCGYCFAAPTRTRMQASPRIFSPSPSSAEPSGAAEQREANPAMGQRQSNPARTKFTTREENDRIHYAASSMQGLLPYMEDAHAAILDLDGNDSTSFFAVYDGHGGANIAKYCAKRFHTELLNDENYQNNLNVALEHVFSSIDEQICGYDEWGALANPNRVGIDFLCCLKTAPAPGVQGTPSMEGTTACVVLIRGNQIIVGNVGDSRCVLSRNGEAIELSIDHKPDLLDERQRIEDAGGQVVEKELDVYRVNGILSVSRAIGNFHFKSDENLTPAEQIVTSIPDIRIEAITHDTEFLLVASDGVWGDTSQDVVTFVHNELNRGVTDPSTICENLIDECISSGDNLTVILVLFKPETRLPPPPPPPPYIDIGTPSTMSDSDVENIEYW